MEAHGFTDNCSDQTRVWRADAVGGEQLGAEAVLGLRMGCQLAQNPGESVGRGVVACCDGTWERAAPSWSAMWA